MADRIVSLVPAATETLFELDLGSKLTAVSHACDHPPEARELPAATRVRIDLGEGSSRSIDEAVRAASASEEPIHEVLEEVLHHADPDLVITQDACGVCGVTPVDVRAALARIEPAGGPEILALHPHTLDDAIEDIRRVGQAAGAPGRGEHLAAGLSDRVKAVGARASAVGERPTVVVLDWLDPPMLAGHWVPGMVELAGGQPLLLDEAEPSRYVEPDALVAADPDVLVLAPCGFDVNRTRRALETLGAGSWLDEMGTIERGRVAVVDADAYTSRPGPRLVDGLEALAHAIHPNAVSPPSLSAIVTLTETG